MKISHITLTTGLIRFLFLASPGLVTAQTIDGGDGIDMEDTGEITNHPAITTPNGTTVDWETATSLQGHVVPAAQLTGLNPDGSLLNIEDLMSFKVQKLSVMTGIADASPAGTTTVIDANGIETNQISLLDATQTPSVLVPLSAQQGGLLVGGNGVLTTATDLTVQVASAGFLQTIDFPTELQSHAVNTLSEEFVLRPASNQGSLDSLLLEGNFGGGGAIPKEGAGTRMMWYPEKAALRAGRVIGTYWDSGNIGDYSTAFGFKSEAAGESSFAVGEGATASGSNSAALGFHSHAVGDGSFVTGINGRADGFTASSFGSAFAGGDYSVAGSFGYAEGNNSVALGSGQALGDHAVSLGGGQAISYNSFAVGTYSSAGGEHSTALSAGDASGLASVAMSVSTASGDFSIAMSNDAYAAGDYSVAMGFSSGASGDHSVAIGNSVIATSYSSVAVGRRNEDRYDSTDAATTAAAKESWQGDNQHSVFEVGIGDGTHQANALTVLQDGSIEFGNKQSDDSYPLHILADGSVLLGGSSVLNASNASSILNSEGFLKMEDGIFNVPSTTPATSSTTGALTVGGGLGVGSDSWINGIRTGRGSGDISSNTVFGGLALIANTTGYSNSAVGNASLRYNTTGVRNTAVGANALPSNISGHNNTAIGSYSLNSNTTAHHNTAIGAHAMRDNVTGHSNIAIGQSTLSANDTGDGNVAIGRLAGRYHADGVTDLTDPEYSVYVGYNARGKDNSDHNSIVIGKDSIGLGANTTVIGNTSTTRTHLHGQTTTPSLEVSGTTSLKGQVILDQPQGDISMGAYQ